ncbi:hypothetical protein H9S92_02090 [Lewinella lacunae]|uniref:Uncharacterized protein n=2 Tax=Neolewinella lacunae TaxID=1517758 RepID=A0A923PKL9_9BACT|nr:hypothetical protein [Neolewinella lacunae]MBC6992943.1 hypothetical protein [Neolewinella lacunae]
MTYLLYKWKRKPMNWWFGKDQVKKEVNAQANRGLSEQQIKRISIIQRALLEVNDTSLEETLDNFRKDLNPDSEIEIWEAIAGAWQHVFRQKPAASLEEKQEVYRLLLLRSSMPGEEVLAQTNLTTLTEATAKEVLELYNLNHKPFLLVG